ncbi:MAG: DNA polymerase/3'-5' exonuclease PolX [Candidatus Tectomicrobia bacterium]|nr:DNA polymerase/3'-5' exonuclease PolX [Candidatus Tectomicrobia bacterium]
MRNAEIADIFEGIADLLDLKGENRFRIVAYRRAAQTLRDLSEPVEAVAERDELTQIPGIGKDLAQKIRDYIAKGRIEQYEKLKAEFPPGLTELLKIPGLGPKTLAMLHRERGVGSVEDLRAALEEGSLLGLPGVQEKTVENLRKGLAFITASGGRRLLGEVFAPVQELLSAVRKIPGVGRAEAAGSLRRMMETVGDVDLLASIKGKAQGKEVVRAFTEIPQVAEVLARGETKGSVRLGDGLQADLRVVADGEFGAALQYFTGSKAHNVKVRGLARQKGLKINEYGVFRGERKLAGKTEKEVYAALGLAYVEPELREDRGEVEAALEGKLPRLVERSDLRGELHVHTEWSDGEGSLREVALKAKAAGYEYVALTDHSVSQRVARGLSADRLRRKLEEIDALNREGPGIRVFRAAEVDILADGSLDYPDDLLKELDVVVAAVHSGFKQSADRMTGRILDALDHPCVHILAHPTGRLLQAREAYAVDLERVLAGAAERGVALEVNGSYQRLDLSDVHARRALDLGATLCLSTDAHRLEAVGRTELAVGQARRAWAKKSDVLNTKPTPKLLEWLSGRRK